MRHGSLACRSVRARRADSWELSVYLPSPAGGALDMASRVTCQRKDDTCSPWHHARPDLARRTTKMNRAWLGRVQRAVPSSRLPPARCSLDGLGKGVGSTADLSWMCWLVAQLRQTVVSGSQTGA